MPIGFILVLLLSATTPFSGAPIPALENHSTHFSDSEFSAYRTEGWRYCTERPAITEDPVECMREQDRQLFAIDNYIGIIDQQSGQGRGEPKLAECRLSLDQSTLAGIAPVAECLRGALGKSDKEDAGVQITSACKSPFEAAQAELRALSEMDICYSPRRRRVAAGGWMQIDENVKMAIQNVVQSTLIDPESARFEWRTDRNRESLFYCSFVNSKNRFGGYVGKEIFAVKFSGYENSALPIKGEIYFQNSGAHQICLDEGYFEILFSE